MLSRREFNTGVSLLALCALAGLPDVALAQRADTVPTAELLEPGQIPDMVMGAENAPVTVIEYASMTCSHCADFAVKTFPEFKKRFIDTGKVRYIFREFPLDPVAAGASLLARCADKDKFFSLVDLLFHTREQWAIQNPIEPLFNVVKQAGYTREAFNACLDTRNNENSRKLLSAIEAGRNRASDKFKVSSTPTFFINGKRVPGALSIDQMEKEIAPFLKA